MSFIESHDAGRIVNTASQLNAPRSVWFNGSRVEWTEETFAVLHPVEAGFFCKTCKYEYYARFGPACPHCRQMPVFPCGRCSKPLMADEAIYSEQLRWHVCWECAQRDLVPPTPFVPLADRGMNRALARV